MELTQREQLQHQLYLLAKGVRKPLTAYDHLAQKQVGVVDGQPLFARELKVPTQQQLLEDGKLRKLTHELVLAIWAVKVQRQPLQFSAL